jgi:hypothetical protein
VHALPVLLLDDFASLTPSLLEQAFVEAQYHFLMGQWDFKRLTRWYWDDLMLNRDLAWLNKQHPLPVSSPVHRLDVCYCHDAVCYKFRNWKGTPSWRAPGAWEATGEWAPSAASADSALDPNIA